MQEEPASASPHDRILTAVLHLLDEQGEAAVSTRAVGAAAGVQAPAIYRLFGDKQGLLEAAVERAYAEWVARKGVRPSAQDPVDDLRSGWDEAVRFGLEHPAVYRIAMDRTTRSPALLAGREVLERKIERAAAAGRLRVAPHEALALMQAAGRGVTLASIEDPAGARGLGALAREAVIAAITTDAPPEHDGAVTSIAAALRTVLPDDGVLRPAERALMIDWLDRIASRRPGRDGDEGP